jgi:hypothetical protein
MKNETPYCIVTYEVVSTNDETRVLVPCSTIVRCWPDDEHAAKQAAQYSAGTLFVNVLSVKQAPPAPEAWISKKRLITGAQYLNFTTITEGVQGPKTVGVVVGGGLRGTYRV